ncbi:unnamed protein product [Gadus morhua 'NCC']
MRLPFLPEHRVVEHKEEGSRTVTELAPVQIQSDVSAHKCKAISAPSPPLMPSTPTGEGMAHDCSKCFGRGEDGPPGPQEHGAHYTLMSWNADSGTQAQTAN